MAYQAFLSLTATAQSCRKPVSGVQVTSGDDLVLYFLRGIVAHVRDEEWEGELKTIVLWE
jgi:hypothetical protein